MVTIQAMGASPNQLEGRTAAEKHAHLLAQLGALDSLLVAYSGGADSAYLAWAAHTALGQRALVITAVSASFSTYDREQAEAFAQQMGLRHECIETREMENPRYVANDADRCYHCKTELFTEMDRLAAARGFAAVAYGVNADDTRDFRPGHRAAAEHKVLAPLLDAALTKAEIRELSHVAGLSTWDRPASACLSSRVPYGMPVTRGTLLRIERGEALLRGLGFRQLRVRSYGAVARIEVAPDELPRAMEMDLAAKLSAAFQQIGFTSVELDPQGYRQGSLNEALKVRATADERR